MIIIWTNMIALETVMLYTKIQPQSFLGAGEDFQEFLPYMDMAAIPFQQKAPCEIWWNLLKWFQRIRHLKITQFYTCI